MFKNVLIKFGSEWCNPCKQAQKFMEKSLDKSVFDSIDVTSNEDLAKRYGIKNIPTFIAFDKNGDEVGRFTGFDPKKILELAPKV